MIHIVSGVSLGDVVMLAPPVKEEKNKTLMEHPDKDLPPEKAPPPGKSPPPEKAQPSEKGQSSEKDPSVRQRRRRPPRELPDGQ